MGTRAARYALFGSELGIGADDARGARTRVSENASGFEQKPFWSCESSSGADDGTHESDIFSDVQNDGNESASRTCTALLRHHASTT